MALIENSLNVWLTNWKDIYKHELLSATVSNIKISINHKLEFFPLNTHVDNSKVQKIQFIA